MTKIGKILTVLSISTFLGCSQPQKEQPRVVYITTPLTLPEKPELPKMNSDALSCISDDSKWTLLKRDVLLKNYISSLETIILSTQKEK